MTTGSIVRVKLPQAGHWKSAQISSDTGAVGEPSVRPSRGMLDGIVTAGAVRPSGSVPAGVETDPPGLDGAAPLGVADGDPAPPAGA